MKKNFIVKESVSAGNAGSYIPSIVLTPQIWTKKQLGPFVDAVSEFINPELSYEEADDDFKQSSEKTKEIENKTKKLAKRNMDMKNYYIDNGKMADNVKMKKEIMMNEDLAVWFGTKKKPKGSNQPKGPWVNICRKEDGKHPPCGRSKAETKGYPKCRAVHVASKMTAAEKKAACQQKRRAEKTDPKIGKGNKPTMTSYKPRKESISQIIKKVLKEQYDSQRLYPVESIYMQMSKAPSELKRIVKNLKPIPCVNNRGDEKTCFRIPEVIHVYLTGRY